MPILAKLIKKLYFDKTLNRIYSSLSDHKKTNLSFFELTWRCASDGTIFMSLAFVDKKLFLIYSLKSFANNSSSTNARDMKTPPFDAHRHDDSNKLLFILLWPIESETSWHFCMPILAKLIKKLYFDKTLNRIYSSLSDHKKTN